MMLSWKKQYSTSSVFALIVLFILATAKTSSAVTESRIDRIKNKVLDETQFSNPKSFDYNFEDDLRKPADTNDIYDELVPYLPTFVLHKNGKNVGRTSVPIITRKMPSWSTPPPKQKYVEPYKPFSPHPLNGFQPRPGLTGLTALVAKSADKTNFPQRVQQQQHSKTQQRTASIKPTLASLARSTTRRSTIVTTKTTRTTIRTTTARPRYSLARQQQPRQQLHVRSSPRPSWTIIKSTISSRNNFVNHNNNNKQKPTNILDATARIRSNNNQQSRPFPKLIGYPYRLSSMSHSSVDAAVIRPQPTEQFIGKSGNIKSNTAIQPRSIQSHAPAKPLIINTGSGPYLGPTFNCKVLTPKNDGKPSPNTDKSCVLSEPGISADGKCRCTFEVSDRDSNGCALGFLFTCSQK